MDEAGTVIDIAGKEDAGDDIATLKGLLCPGFINAHCHLELSHLKGAIPEKTGLVSFVQQVMSMRGPSPNNIASPNNIVDNDEANAHDSLKQIAIEGAGQELYDGGTVAVADICNTMDTVSLKHKSKLRFHNFLEVSGFVDAGAELRLRIIQKLLHEFKLMLNNQHSGLSPHAPYSVSKKLFSQLNEHTAYQLISIHNQECGAEDLLYKNKAGNFIQLYENFGIDAGSFEPTGKTSLQSWLPYFNQHQSVILVHNTFTSEADIDFAKKYGEANLGKLYYCICINANKYIEAAVPPIHLLREKGCKVVLGTDSYASNHQLNIFEEIKSIQTETSQTIPLPELLKWATINGAEALNMDDKLGSFDKGKQPGLVLIEQLVGLETSSQSFARRII